MKTSTILQSVAAVALLSSFGIANAAHTPSPCSQTDGQAVDSSQNCMYIVAGGGAVNNYDSLTGDRTTTTSSTLNLDVWIDFGTWSAQGGGFDILVDTAGANITSMSWAWNFDDLTTNEISAQGSRTGGGTGNVWAGTQIDHFGGGGFYGTADEPFTGDPNYPHTTNGFIRIGTLTVGLASPLELTASIQLPYDDNGFPNCFAAGAGGPAGAPSGCLPTNLYSLSTVNAVPVPAAAWLMISALGGLAGFSRRKVA